MENSKCSSCKTSLANDVGAVSFKCPSCKKHEISRCSQCRKLASKYHCECGFGGPN